MLLKIGGELVVDHLIHQSTDIGIAQLGLGLALELGVRQLDGDDGGNPLPAVLAGDLVVALDDADLHTVGVQHPGQRGLEARLVHTALGGPHVVGKGHHELIVAVVVLHGDLRGGVPLGAAHIDHVVVKGGLVAVAPDGKLPDAALIAHGFADLFLIIPVVGDGDGQTGIEECLLPHPLVEDLIVVDQGIKHLRIRLEGDLGAGLVGFSHDLHFLGDLAPGKLHLINAAVLVDPNPQPLGQGIDHGGAHAVKAAGDLIASAAELAAGVQHGVHHLQSGPSRLGLDIHGNAAAVIGDGDGIAGVDGHGYVLAVARQSFVNGVVHDLIDQVMQARRGSGADIHTGPLPDSLQPLQDLDLLRAVLLCYFRFIRHNILQRNTECRGQKAKRFPTFCLLHSAFCIK